MGFFRAFICGAACMVLGGCALFGPARTGPQSASLEDPAVYGEVEVTAPVDCDGAAPAVQVNDRDRIFRLDGEAALFFHGAMRIDADGSPNAYHPREELGLDHLRNAGRPGRWWGIATGDDGEPIIQGADDPFPGFYVSTTSLTRSGYDNDDPRNYVDATRIPYFVLPGRDRLRAVKALGARLGDIAAVYNLRTERYAFAIWADVGPPHKLGEGSIRLASLVGYENVSARHGGTAARENFFLVFPGSGDGTPLEPPEIEARGQKLLEEWGGLTRLKTCAGHGVTAAAS